MNVKDVIREAKRLERQIKDLSTQYNENMYHIKSFFDKKGSLKTIEVDPKKGGHIKLVAVRTERVYIKYIVERLEKVFAKKTLSKFVEKTYVITDFKGLIDLLKEHGISPVEFKQYIRVESSVNKDKLKQLYELGEISKEELKGCYTAEVVKSVQIKEK